MRYVTHVIRLLAALGLVTGIGWGGKRISSLSKQPAQTTMVRADLMDTARVREGTFLITVPATGRLQASKTTNVYSPDMQAKVSFVAPDGVPVKQGDVLIKFDDTDFRRDYRDRELAFETAKADSVKTRRDRDLELRNAQGQVDRLKEELRILKETNATQIRLAEAQLQFDQANHDRAKTEMENRKRQAAEHLIPITQLETAEADFRTQQFAVDKSQKDLASKRERASALEEQKQTDLDNAVFVAETTARRAGDETGAGKQRIDNLQRQLEAAKQQLDWCTIKAPAAGLFLLTKNYQRGEGTRRATRVGDQVWSQTQLAEIPDLARMQIVCKVPERDIGSVEPGQETILRLEQNPDASFGGKVARIGGIASEVDPTDTSGLEPGTKIFNVNIELVGTRPHDLLPGMTATVEIVTRRLPHAAFIRKDTIFEDGDYHIVYKRKENTFVPVRVTPGAENLDFVQIKQGVKPGDQVARQRPITRAEGGI
jgi:HlyD family secretion protein